MGTGTSFGECSAGYMGDNQKDGSSVGYFIGKGRGILKAEVTNSKSFYNFLDNLFTVEEICAAAFDLGPTKAPSQDDRITDYPLISLCNVVYKIMAKTMANGLRLVLAEVLPLGIAWKFEGFWMYTQERLVRSGATVKIYEDKWFPRPVTFKVLSPKISENIWLVRHLRTASDKVFSDKSGYKVGILMEDASPSTYGLQGTGGVVVCDLVAGMVYKKLGIHGSGRHEMPPSPSFYKFNTDAGIDAQSRWVGFGMVIRDHVGSVLGASAQVVVAEYAPPMAEAMAILQGLNFAIDSGILPIVVKYDAVGVVNMMNSDTVVYANVGYDCAEPMSLNRKHYTNQETILGLDH
ncbi:hypothetical protein Dsin_008448 [Dipteronia sinensis]|uniref:RNase H type-1 domain-containing protein n=1 Tax=Dipteronia sinensis TaxID=43782 RepID=A0AAE0EAP1_9ROSI|nr:hypothetical protein Dsin_008448 [Dipteronia sinensis]